MQIHRLASIDIGTNAARLLIMNVLENGQYPYYQKLLLTRVPLRLGDDVFPYKQIRKEKIANFIETMDAFKHLMNVYDVTHHRACATSAMREASNGEDVTYLIKKSSGIQIEIISGKEEAEILYSTHLSQLLKEKKTYLYVDVGGGSTEVSLFADKKHMASHSFNLGTIRMLRNQVPEGEWQLFEQWLTQHVGNKYNNLQVIGSGGNINKLYKEAEIKRKKPLPADELRRVYETIEPYSVEERMFEFGFKPDRADVIIPASEIYLKVLEITGAKEIEVPKIGLTDGIIRQLYQQVKGDR